jgi:acetyltransferase-like isoleucine patch superfamily enzyme
MNKNHLRKIKKFVCLFINRHGQRKISLIKTLYYNFYLFPFSTAKRLPLFIHAGVKIYKIGKIIIEGKIKRGMISIGCLDIKSQGISKILNHGEIIFKGQAVIEGAIIIENHGQIIFGDGAHIGEGGTFLITKRLSIGKCGSIGFHSFFMDTDCHYMININTGEIKNNKKEIIIGDYNWLGYGTIVKKGTHTPDYTIVALSNTILSKDYTHTFPPYSIIGGTPVKLIASGYRRIFNVLEQRKLSILFRHEGHPSTIIDLENINIDEYCTNTPLSLY